MKANELMIGDWVCYDGDENHECPVRIDAINTEEAGVEGDYNDMWEPIPLTSAILEKNGFGRIDGKGTDFLIKGFLYWSSFAKRIFVQGHPNQIDWIDVCECQYVHELQHMLKLYGIEKEIVL